VLRAQGAHGRAPDFTVERGFVGTRDVITVDGLGASGKSALAMLLAKKLGYGHLNSGLLYRAAGWLVLQEQRDVERCEDVVEVVGRHSIELQQGAELGSVVLIDGIVRDRELASAEVSHAASAVAKHQPLRDAFLDAQRNAFAPNGVVAEGRDMGTIIFPDARIKFFVEGDLDVRAHRRWMQVAGTPHEVTLDSIRQALAERDERDATRAVAPMKPAEGAIIIDNSKDPLHEVVERMYQIVTGANHSSVL
jgi:cytidylate kinase